jgi:hypothetical protein
MRRLVRLLIVTMPLIAPSTGISQQMCATGFGTCQIKGEAVPGGSCYCVTPNGPVQGVVQDGGKPPADQHPQYCCTPSGRLGPYPNNKIPVGQKCQGVLPNGTPMVGQACF